MQEKSHNTRTLADSNVVHETPLPSSGTRLSSHEIDFSQQSMADNIGISQEDSIPSFQPTLNSVAPSQDDLSPPPPINLETSSLRRSPRIAAQINSDAPAISAYVTSTMPVTSRQYTRPKQRLLFYCWVRYTRTGVLAYWRTGVLAYWRTGVLAYWRTKLGKPMWKIGKPLKKAESRCRRK